MPKEVVKCQFCGKDFYNSASRDRHIHGVHLKIRPYKCSICDMTFTQKFNCDKHQQHVHGNVSSHCSPAIRKPSLYTESLKQKTPKMADSPTNGDNRKPTCNICQKVFSSRFVMLRHRRGHMSVKDNQIGETSSTNGVKSQPQSGPKKEVNKRLQRREFSCDICQRVFPLSASMVRHRKGHFLKDEGVKKRGRRQIAMNYVDKTKTACDICNKAFTFRLNMLKHRRLHFSKEASPVEDNKTPSVNLNQAVESCTDTSEKASVAGDRPTDVKTVADKHTDGTCNICGKTYCNKSSMLRHRKTHFRPSSKDLQQRTCTICKRMLADKYSLRNHLNSMHAGTNKPKSYFMNDHKVSIDTSDSKVGNEPETQQSVKQDKREEIDKMFRSAGNSKCLICRKKFSTSWTLKIHVNSVHLNLRPYKCKFCGFSFNQNGDLARHVRGKHSSMSSDRPAQHQRKASKDTHSRRVARRLSTKAGIPTKTCLICSKVFSQRNSMLRHKRLMHTESSVEENEPRTKKTEIPEHEDIHVSPKSRPINDQESSRDLSDSELENKSQTRHHVDQEVKIKEMMRSTGKRECLICRKTFTRLRLHVQGVHLNLRPHKCKFCGFTSNQKADLTRHVQCRHSSMSPDRPVHQQRMATKKKMRKSWNWQSRRGSLNKLDRFSKTCPLCSKVFSNRNSMLRHKRMMHTLGPESSVNETKTKARKTKIPEQEGKHVWPKSSLINNLESSRDSSDLKLENIPETKPIDDEDERKKIEEMMKSTGNSKCLVCHKKFSICAYLKLHVQAVHLNLRPYKCKYCGFAFQNKGNMTVHIRRKHSLVSIDRPVQYQRMASKDKLDDEPETPHIIGLNERKMIDLMMKSTGKTQCLICHKRFYLLKRHVKAVHLKIRLHKCKYCKHAFAMRYDLKVHLRSVHRDMESEPPTTNGHRDTHTDSVSGLHTLKPENESLRQSSETNTVKRTPERTSEPKDAAIDDGAQAVIKKAKSNHTIPDRSCGVCHKVFNYRVELLRHKRLRHPLEQDTSVKDSEPGDSPHRKTPEKESLEFPYVEKRYSREERTCAFCEKFFPYRREMLQHQQVHIARCKRAAVKEEAENDPPLVQGENSLECPTEMCQEEREKIQDMLKSDYTGTKCRICQKDFKARWLLVRHVNCVHLKLKPHKCKYCGNVFSLDWNLKSHLRIVHKNTQADSGSVQDSELPSKKTPLKNIECDICNKLFVTNFSMLRHKRIHTSDNVLGEKITPNLHDVNNTTRDTQTCIDFEKCENLTSNPTEGPEVMTQRQFNSTSSEPAVKLTSFRHRNQSSSSHSSWSQSVGSSPSGESSHSSMSVHSPRSSHMVGSIMDVKVYRCSKCDHIFTNSEDWRDHLSRHLCGGTEEVCFEEKDCGNGEQTTENSWSYTCPACKVEIVGSFNLVMHIKEHMMQRSEVPK